MHGDILEQLTRFYLGHITNDGRSETENRIKIDLAKNIFNINKYIYNKDFAHNILSCKIGLFTETIPQMPIGRSAKKKHCQHRIAPNRQTPKIFQTSNVTEGFDSVYTSLLLYSLSCALVKGNPSISCIS